MLPTYEVNPEIFKEYDIRGIVGKDIDEDTFLLIGKAFATYLKKELGKSKPQVVVGNDCRLSSSKLKEAFIEGLLESGCDVSDVGLATAPMIYFASCNYAFDASAYVTASHNPVEYNGIKFTFSNAKPIFGKQLQQLKKIIETKKFSKSKNKGKLSKKEIISDYIKMLKSKVKLKNCKNVIIDCGNGCAGLVAAKIFPNAEIIFEKPDGTFPNHLPDPTRPELMKVLIDKCKREKKIGIGFDGDADRISVFDESGRMLLGDELMIIFVRDILKRHPKAKIIFEVKSSQALYDEIVANGGIPIMWKAGHSLIKAKMRAERAILAGEVSGHIFFADNYYGYDDAAYAAMRLLEIMHRSNSNISDLLEGAPKYFSSPEYRIDCKDNEKFKIVAELKKYFLAKYKNSITIDGIRIVMPHGWALIRASNTQPKLILRFEAKTEKALNKIKAEVISKLKEYAISTNGLE